MLTLPEEYHTLIKMFGPIFSKRMWHRAQVLLVGAILAHGQRTVTAVFRVMGLSADKHFQNYHYCCFGQSPAKNPITEIMMHQGHTHGG